MPDQIDADGFRSNVGIVLMRRDRRVFLGRRKGGRGWQFPQGGVQQGERPEEALYRELLEEVGLRPHQVRLRGSTRRWLRYRLPPQFVRRDTQPVCVGQKQRWFLLDLADEREEFHLDRTTLPEFDAWRWADYWEPLREVIAFKRKVYEQVLHELGAIAFPHGLPPYPDWWPEIAPSARTRA
ncbi:MAG: RNA pyrophosphohydrolase [Steroidobacteraceae bacterium]|nr:RNA pyrophosphohydrolase [Steroidobacteraceae bacterium]